MYFLYSGFLTICACPENRVCSEIFHCIEIFLSLRIFEQLALALKNSLPEIFCCIEYPFYIREFWATCACLKNLRLAWKTELPWTFWKFFTVLNILFTFGGFATCACPEKQSVPWIHCTEDVFFIIQDFWATCACPENRVCPEIFQTRVRGRPPPRTPMMNTVLQLSRPAIDTLQRK